MASSSIPSVDAESSGNIQFDLHGNQCHIDEHGILQLGTYSDRGCLERCALQQLGSSSDVSSLQQCGIGSSEQQTSSSNADLQQTIDQTHQSLLQHSHTASHKTARASLSEQDQTSAADSTLITRTGTTTCDET